VLLNDSSYSWSLLVLHAEAGTTVELTNANAISVGRIVARVKQLSPENRIFDGARNGVFRIEAGLWHGSGFLTRLPGIETPLVITNDHVVGQEKVVTVYLDSTTRVPAAVVLRDPHADVAFLRMAQGRCRDCPTLPLAEAPPGSSPAAIGDHVMAIGYPLHQEITLTTGVVSSVRSGAIISDVNVNHGNSGGPLLNMAGEVIGIITFADLSDAGGPGISGATPTNQLTGFFALLPKALVDVSAPPDRALPSIPRGTYPLSALAKTADGVSLPTYKDIEKEDDQGHFKIRVSTPVSALISRRRLEEGVGSERKKREAQSGVSNDETYAQSIQGRDWEQYVGPSNSPVVSIIVSPKFGETRPSAFFRGLAGTRGIIGQASVVFEGDVRGVRFYRNGVEIEPLLGGHAPFVEDIDNPFIKFKDVADYGFYVFSPDVFRPDSSGAPAQVKVAIQDLTNPNYTSVADFEGALSAQIWNDFRGYFESVRPDIPFLTANPRMKNPKVEMQCLKGSCARW
jgi:S1-C subfamily serine protease